MAGSHPKLRNATGFERNHAQRPPTVIRPYAMTRRERVTCIVMSLTLPVGKERGRREHITPEITEGM